MAALGPVLATLGVLSGASREALGIILELCQSTFGGPKALGKRFGSDVCKYCKTLKSIGKYCKNGGSEEQKWMENNQNTYQEAIFGRNFDEEPPTSVQK